MNASGRAQEVSMANDAMDEIVITGSLIQRSNYQLTSPIDVVQRDELELKAPLNAAEFVRDLPYNFGSDFSSGRAMGNERGAGTINLRGLGTAATLVLINGRRQTQLPDAADNVVDVNSLVPEIMLERIEILKDGASATYGSDAIAGVANFITRDKFEGFSMSVRGNHFTYSNADDVRVEALWGGDLGSRTHVVAAMGIYDQQPINGYAFTTPSQDPSTALETRFSSSSSSPGEFVVPRRNAAGQLIAGSAGQRRNVVDPECGNIASTIPTVGTSAVANASLAADCRYNFWADNGSQSEIRRYTGMVRATSDLTDSIQFEGEFAYSYVESATAYTAGETLGGALTIPGHNPGNIYYRAADANGNPLYAVSSGVSAGYMRDGAEVFLPMRDSAGRVVLTGTPTNPASGIPFYEDIGYAGRLMNSQGDLPTQNALAPGEFAWSRPSISKNHIMRMAAGLSGDLFRDWNWRAGLAYSRYDLSSNGVVGNGLRNELNFALQGLGGASCDRTSGRPGVSGCEYFNPFGNSVFATPGTARANTESVIGYVFPYFNDQYESSMLEGNVIFSGSVFELPGGPLGVALGYQYRRSTLAIDYDISANTNNRTNGVVAQDIDVSRSIDAVFGEVNLPVMRNDLGYLELTGALRHEWIGGLTTTDPKLGVQFQTDNQFLTVRGSYGTSFIAPSLFRLHAVSARGTAVNDCPVLQGPPCTGEANLRILLYENGNPTLEPEKSTAWSAGFTVKPLDRLKFDAGWWRFNFRDKIATQTATSVVNANPNGTPENPVIRDATGRILSVTALFINQASVITEGIDFALGYDQPLGNLGDLKLSLAGTYAYKYDFQDTVGGPILDGAGATNDRLTAPPNTKLRINTRATWHYENHTLSAALRYYGKLDFTLDPAIKIGSWTPIDLTYTYRLGLGDVDSLLSIGAVNILGEKEPQVPSPGFQPFIPRLHDTRGRSIWAKVDVTF